MSQATLICRTLSWRRYCRCVSYRAQAPLLDSLLNDVGINAGDINGLTNVLGTVTPPQTPKS